MVVIADGDAREILASRPTIDREETRKVASILFPKERLEPQDDSCLTWTSPPDDQIHIGCFPGLTIVAAKEFAIDNPSRIPTRFLDFAGTRAVHVHAMHSVVDWFAFAVWRNGKLERSLSLSPDSGIVEDIGQRLSFEVPYWEGSHPAIDPADMEDGEPDYPFPFHPLELGEAALAEFFGYQLEGYVDQFPVDSESIPLLQYKRKKALFKLW
ncbi:hypothetical protein [Pelomonas sp. KK5]|uniref:DUF6928 family protein n=1 Tax=Pelomonas sp. KK5 TaxID=1855730 RepID=UPI001E54ACFC|nr:hypothetical protein [Pelomonas sp. KK5]